MLSIHFGYFPSPATFSQMTFICCFLSTMIYNHGSHKGFAHFHVKKKVQLNKALTTREMGNALFSLLFFWNHTSTNPAGLLLMVSSRVMALWLFHVNMPIRTSQWHGLMHQNLIRVSFHNRKSEPPIPNVMMLWPSVLFTEFLPKASWPHDPSILIPTLASA